MNNGYFGSIDTDAGIGTILSNFNSEYVNHVISDSLEMRFRPFDGSMPNMVDVLERQFLSVLTNAPDYADKIKDVKTETYKEIIMIICNYYNLSFISDFDSIEPSEIHGIAHTLYDIFVARFTEFAIDFFVSYIVNNADSIVSYLKASENANKPKESGLYSPKNFIDQKYILIHANINQVIYNMAGYDISLQQLLQYFLDPVSCDRISNIIVDNGDIYKNFYACFITDQRYSANLLTSIKLKLQSRTQEALSVIG